MTPRPTARALAALIGVLFAAALAQAEAPTIYKWVDENGVAHYTTDRNRIPSEVRAKIQRTAPAVAAPPHSEDEMRDAVRTKPKPSVAAPAAQPVAAPPAEPPAPRGQAPTATAAIPAPASQPAPAIEAEPPPPLASELLPSETAPEIDPVSAPPPAPVAPLTPKQGEEVAKIDTQIESLEGQIAEREEKLATLLSVTDEGAAPLIDDPKFREIAQVLPKLQAELQTLRERRNKIQSPATP